MLYSLSFTVLYVSYSSIKLEKNMPKDDLLQLSNGSVKKKKVCDKTRYGKMLTTIKPSGFNGSIYFTILLTFLFENFSNKMLHRK